MRKILLTMMALIAGTTLSFADDSYELVTSASSLQAGDEVLIVYSSGTNSNYAMGAQSGTYRSGVSVAVKNSTITLASTNTDITRFTIGKSSSYWTFYSESDKGYLGVTSGSLTITSSVGTYNNISLNIASTGATYFRFGTNSNNYRYLTYTTSNNRFSTTTSQNTTSASTN